MAFTGPSSVALLSNKEGNTGVTCLSVCVFVLYLDVGYLGAAGTV